MWWRVDMATEVPIDYWGRILTTYSNKNLTDKQIKNFENKITTEEDRERWLRGVRPKGIGDQFSADMIENCTDRSLNAIMDEALKEKRKDFYVAAAEKAGINIWEMPYEEGRIYMVIGDPGQGNPPNRNAPCIGVFDVTDFPGKPAVLRAFWWGLGRGSYQPFVQTMYRYAEKYQSLDLAFDATGSQKMMDELVFERDGLNIHGLNMTGLKHAFNTSLKLFMDKALIMFPEIPGIRAQLGNYRFPDKKIAQDIVAMLQMAAGYLRRFYYVSSEEDEDEDWEDDNADSRYARSSGSRHARGRASRNQR